MTERRSQIRLSDSELVMLGWREGLTTLKQLANVEDVSPNGVGIIAHHKLPVGSSVSLTYGDGELTGVVKHHSKREAGYFIGIEFDEGSKNSPLHIQPELLIRVG